MSSISQSLSSVYQWFYTSHSAWKIKRSMQTFSVCSGSGVLCHFPSTLLFFILFLLWRLIDLVWNLIVVTGFWIPGIPSTVLKLFWCLKRTWKGSPFLIGPWLFLEFYIYGKTWPAQTQEKRLPHKLFGINSLRVLRTFWNEFFD